VNVNCIAYLANVELLDRPRFSLGVSSRPRCTDTESMSTALALNSRYSLVWSEADVGFLYNFNRSEEQTTVTELAAIAAEAIQG
jgi:hypothetical protein